MFAAAFLEIAENATIELEDLGEASALQKRRSFLTANATSAKGHDWFVFQMTGQRCGGGWEFAEMIEVERTGAAEGTESYFVGVAGIEKGDGSALVQPFLQLARRNFWGGAAAGIDSRDTEGDYLFPDLHQHSIERLMITFAYFRGEVSETGNGSKVIEKAAGGVSFGRHEDVDSFRAEKDCAPHFRFDTHRTQRGLELLQIAQRSKFISRNVGEDRHELAEYGAELFPARRHAEENDSSCEKRERITPANPAFAGADMTNSWQCGLVKSGNLPARFP